MDKYQLLHRFLSWEENLSEEIRLNCLPIFLDKRTQFFSFEQETDNQQTIKSIFEIITRYCPNIETIDFRSLWIRPENKENFKSFLKKTIKLKSLRVVCDGLSFFCALNQLRILTCPIRMFKMDSLKSNSSRDGY